MKNKTTTTVKLPFQQVFAAVVGFTLLSASASFWLASQKELSHEESKIFEICNTTWGMGIGSIFGLLGSKKSKVFDSDEES